MPDNTPKKPPKETTATEPIVEDSAEEAANPDEPVAIELPIEPGDPNGQPT
jgi:hypothetical protein